MPVFRILAVDDSASIVELLALTLQDMGHDVRTAESGFDALLQLEMEPPDVIISDIAMPGISGHELARRIRSDRRWGKIALVGISGMGQPRDAEAALKAGFDYFLVKPAQIEEIEKIFRAIAWRAESLKSKEEPE